MEFTINTSRKNMFVNITGEIERRIAQSDIKEGICLVYCPHTTAGITINEGADPDVVMDIIMELDKRIPWNDGYKHSEGNSAAHIKSSLVGASEHIIIEKGRLKLGTWQKVYFCEFDGPRTRQVWIKMLGTP